MVSTNWLPDWGKPLGELSDIEDGEDEATVEVEEQAEAAVAPGGPLTVEGVTGALSDVYDPELAINIVDLGLIYGVDIDEGRVHVRMTLTSPGCPVGPMLQAMAQGAVKRVYPDVEDVRVEIVWSPPWDPYKMASEEAKDMLGIW